MTTRTHDSTYNRPMDTVTNSPTASIRRMFSPHQQPSSPYTPGSLEMLVRQGVLSKQDHPLKGEEGLSIHKIQLFFKNVSESLHLQDEIGSADTANVTNSKYSVHQEGNTLTPRDKSLSCKESDHSSSYFYEEISEDLKDQSDLPTRDNDSKYGRLSKESHPFFDGRFVEIDGLIQYDPDWREKQKEEAKRKRRGRRRIGAWGRNIVASKAA